MTVQSKALIYLNFSHFFFFGFSIIFWMVENTKCLVLMKLGCPPIFDWISKSVCTFCLGFMGPAVPLRRFMMNCYFSGGAGRDCS